MQTVAARAMHPPEPAHLPGSHDRPSHPHGSSSTAERADCRISDHRRTGRASERMSRDAKGKPRLGGRRAKRSGAIVEDDRKGVRGEYASARPRRAGDGGNSTRMSLQSFRIPRPRRGPPGAPADCDVVDRRSRTAPSTFADLETLLPHLLTHRLAHPLVDRLLRRRFPMTLARRIHRSPARPRLRRRGLPASRRPSALSRSRG